VSAGKGKGKRGGGVVALCAEEKSSNDEFQTCPTWVGKRGVSVRKEEGGGGGKTISFLKRGENSLIFHRTFGKKDRGEKERRGASKLPS